MYSFIKRFFDILASLLTLIILSPFLIPIIIGLKLTGEGYIWYFQKRVGYKNQFFDIWKFATMLKNSPNMGTGSLTTRNDPRVTPMGGFLRKTKINELPQVVNVLIGNMSIVGPRPQMQVDFDIYPEKVKKHIYDSVPGITGIGSIVFRDEEKLMSETDMPIRDFYVQHIAPYKGLLELWYQDNKSFMTDTKIIILTAWAIFFPETDLTYQWFPDLPPKPAILILEEK